MSGFGPIAVEHDEPVFHEQWEASSITSRAKLASYGRRPKLRTRSVDLWDSYLELA